MAQSTAPSYHALVELEKGSPGSPREQLKEAARIIRLDLDSQAHARSHQEFADVASAQNLSAPKEEWVLRWLMKKLKAAQDPTSGYRVDRYSWILLRALFTRLSPKPVAAILSENKFLGILDQSLVALREAPHRQYAAGSEGSEADSRNLDSAKGSRKRKRTETAHEVPAPSSSSDLLLVMLESVQPLVSLLSRIPADQVPIRSQLKLVLKGDPALAARILAHALTYACDAHVQNVGPRSGNFSQRLLSSLRSTVTIWEHRSDGPDKVSSNDAFMSNSLSPALRMLLNLQNLPLSVDKEAVVHEIERLVVLHVVLPLRERFFSSIPARSGRAAKHAEQEQVRVISSEIDSHFASDTHGNLLPVVFNIAIRSLHRDTFRSQMNEAPWLETLFVSLTARLGCPIETEFPQAISKDSVLLLQELLQVAIDRRLRISLNTLARYAERFSGLITESDEKIVHWRLVAQLIEINVDVFLPNSGFAESKVLLEKLIGRITSTYLDRSSVGTETWTTIRTGVVIPLLRGFSGARDLETFVQIWKEQIAVLESSRSSGDDTYLYSVWEDDDLLKAYGDVVSTTFPTDHIKSQVLNLSSEIHTKRNSDVYATTIFMEAYLMCSPQRGESLVDGHLFEKAFAASRLLLDSKTSVHWRWRLWRIIQNLFDKLQSSAMQASTNLTTSMLPNAIQFLKSFLQEFQESHIKQRRETLCAFQFIVSIVTRADIPGGSEYLNTLVSSFQTLLSSVGKSSEPAWNGRIETLESPQTVAIGSLGAFLAEPAAVARLSSENRRLLFSTILLTFRDVPAAQLSSLSANSAIASSLKGQLVEVWNSFVSADWLLSASPAVSDLVKVICTHLTDNPSTRSLLLKSLLNIPTRLISPHLRVTLLDSLLDIIRQDQHNSDMGLGVLSLVKRLVELPKSHAKIVTNCEAVWEIADSISLEQFGDVQSVFQVFSQLHKSVVDRVMISSETHRRDYIQETGDKILSSAGKFTSTTRYASLSYFMLCLSLSWVHANKVHLKGSSDMEELDALRHDIFQTSISDLQSLARQVKKRPEELDETVLRGILSVLNTFPDLLQAKKDARKAIQKLDEYMARADANPNTRNFVKRQHLARLKPGSDLLTEVMTCASRFPISLPYAAEQSLFVRELQLQISSMRKKSLIELVRNIRQPAASKEHAPYHLIVAGIAISSFGQIESRESPEASELSSLFTMLSNSLHGFTLIEPFTITTECIDLLLRTHPKCVSQWNVDNLMASISIIISKSGPSIPREWAPVIYSRLCRLLGTLFGLYRKKLSGRYHLVLPPLQRLLWCLFTRDSRATKSSSSSSSAFASELPPWLGDLEETPLQPEHAGQYCRLLTSLCDPTVSAVQLQRNAGGNPANQGLSDSTKKVKSLAGQYLQYIVMEYACCQLRGHLSPATKAALLPGLYTVLDVMSRDAMRAMNAAMDSSSRAVWKGLYDDYVRFGKWNHD